jgi:DNA-binding PadR family transcriptional regulator
MLNHIVLGMVYDSCLTGYDIKKHIENGIGIFYKASFGSLYPTLKKLVDKGCLVTSENPYGRRQKIFYEITDDGKKEFINWLKTPMNVFDGTNTHLAKVFFFDKLPADIRDRQLLEFEINYENYLIKLKSLERNYDKFENKDCFYYKLSTLYYGICVTQRIIQWCKHIRSGEPLTTLIQMEGKGK